MKKISISILTRNFAIVLLMFCVGISAFGQSTLDLNQIKKDTQDSASAYNYERLIFKYRGMPQSLDSLEARNLYYGKVFSNYKTKPSDEKFKKFSKAFQDRDFKTAISLGEDLTFNDPTNIEILLLLLQCYEQEKIQNKFIYTLQKFRAMTATVMTSGDGETENSPYVVNSVGEEFALLTILKIPFNNYVRSSKMFQDGVMDMWAQQDNKLYIKVLHDQDILKK